MPVATTEDIDSNDKYLEVAADVTAIHILYTAEC